VSAINLVRLAMDRPPVCELCGFSLARWTATGKGGGYWYVCDECKGSKALMG
jgi:tRNA(Ile2) C34 agmatinyltransferase TiaS